MFILLLSAKKFLQKFFFPFVLIDLNHFLKKGHEVVIVKNGLRMCGSGGCLASAPLVQNKSYFEVKLQQGGVWGCGVASRSADVNAAPGGHDSESWVLCSDLCIRHNQSSIYKVNNQIQEGDIIVSYYHIQFYSLLPKKK